MAKDKEGRDVTDLPGLWDESNMLTCAKSNSSSTLPPLTTDALYELMRKFPPRRPMVVLLLEQHRAEMLRRGTPRESLEIFPFSESKSSLNGVPVEFYNTIVLLNAAAIEHENAGRNVIRIDF